MVPYVADYVLGKVPKKNYVGFIPVDLKKIYFDSVDHVILKKLFCYVVEWTCTFFAYTVGKVQNFRDLITLTFSGRKSPVSILKMRCQQKNHNGRKNHSGK